MSRDLRDHGYALSLHKQNEDPMFGFGYKASQEEEIKATRDAWNSHTKDNCRTQGTCHMCEYIAGGGKYQVTHLGAYRL